MGKIGKFVNRLLKRGETAGTSAQSRMEAANCSPDDPVMCVDGKLYRMRFKNGRWETFGPPLGDCSDED